MSIDTLGYVKRLEAAGFERRQAEAQAEALRDEIIPQLATKLDLDRLGDRLSGEIVAVRHELKHELASMRSEMASNEKRLRNAAVEALTRHHPVAVRRRRFLAAL